MKRKPLLISAVAAAAGVALMQLYMKRLEEETSGGPPVSVLIATQDIAPGTVLTRQMLGVRSLPERYVEQRHIRASDRKDVLGAPASIGIQANQSLLYTDLGTLQAAGRTLSGLIREGMRAISIRPVASSFGGLMLPGDRVDVLFTAASGPNVAKVQSSSTSTLLQNLLVLAVGADIGDSQQEGPSPSGRRGQVTLSVTAEQGQLLTQAEHQGRLKLVLRNPEDIVLLDGLPQTTASNLTATDRQRSWPQPRRHGSSKSERTIEHVR